MKFPELSKPESLEKIYLNKMAKKTLSLLKGLLKLDPTERLTAEEALRHPFFDGLNKDLTEAPMSKRNLTATK
jgi:cyclin-dependent kinase-like